MLEQTRSLSVTAGLVDSCFILGESLNLNLAGQKLSGVPAWMVAQ